MTDKTMRKATAAGCLIGTAWLMAAAGELVVGTGETHAFTNTADVVQTDAVRVSNRATLVQRGSGTTTLKGGAFTENAAVAVNVQAGTVKLEASEPLVTAYTEPTEVMNTAAFWVDATRNVQLRDGAEDEVAAWLDVRETGAGTTESPYLYTRAVAFTNAVLTAFPQRKTFHEKQGVYFRGYGSGCFMNWVKPDGSQQNVTGIRHAFVVHGVENAVGDFLGQRSTASWPYFQRTNGGLSPLWVRHNAENTALHSSRTYLNGTEVGAFNASYLRDALFTVEVEALGDSLGAMCFFNDRDMQLKATDGTTKTNENGKAVNMILGTASWNGGGNRAGGDDLFEVVLFTNALTTAERLAVSDWLNQKWRNVAPPTAAPAVEVALAEGSTFESDALAAGGTVAGDGTLRKRGDNTFTMRSSSTPHNSALHVAVEGGTLNLGYAVPLICAAGDTLVSERRYWGPELAPPQAGTDAKRLVKTGSGPITLDAIPEGVTRLEVNAGELRLAAPEAPQGLVPTVAATAEVAFPDPGFETYTASSHTGWRTTIGNGGEANGWHAIVPAQVGTADSAVFFFDQALNAQAPEWGMIAQSPATGVFVIKNNGSAWCTVEIPSNGDYVLSFRAAPRNSGHAGEQLDVMIGDDENTLESFGDFKATATKWTTYSFLPKRLTAGTKQFWLKAKNNNTDRCTQFDDFALTRVADADSWPLPNGGFETHTADFNSSAFTAANTNGVIGYALTQHTDEYAKGESETDWLTAFSPKGAESNRRFNAPWNKDGSATQLYMSGYGSTLTTTFTPPAGTWRFRADFSSWAVTTSSSWSSYGVTATLTHGGTSVDLGQVSTSSPVLRAYTWPNAFTADGTTPVTLTLTGACTSGGVHAHGILDNLALVRTPSNLLTEGGFESATPWTIAKTPKPNAVGGSLIIAYDGSYKKNFGSEAFEGGKCLKIVNDDAVSQSVTFPTGGLYRFSANLASRRYTSSGTAARNHLDGNGLNPIAFYLARNGVTNWVGCTDSVAMTNFHEYAYLVRVPDEGGTWEVGFRGMSVWNVGETKVDRTTLVDAAQLYRIETRAPLALAKDLEIVVAAGAQLTLDFDGTNEIDRLSIAGRSYWGDVSLATHPELLGTLSGCGTLFIRPKGTVFILR